jgi:hypothetical protein
MENMMMDTKLMTTAEIQNEVCRRALEAGYSCNLHKSMGGSEYQQIACEFDFTTVQDAAAAMLKWDTYTVRYADHTNRSTLPNKGSRPEWEFLVGQEGLWESILNNIEFLPISLHSVLVKKTVMAKLAGLTVPALKKRLSSAAYCEICENPYYENTLTQVVKLSVAVAELGIDEAQFAREHAASRKTTSVYQYPDGF